MCLNPGTKLSLVWWIFKLVLKLGKPFPPPLLGVLKMAIGLIGLGIRPKQLICAENLVISEGSPFNQHSGI